VRTVIEGDAGVAPLAPLAALAPLSAEAALEAASPAVAIAGALDAGFDASVERAARDASASRLIGCAGNASASSLSACRFVWGTENGSVISNAAQAELMVQTSMTLLARVESAATTGKGMEKTAEKQGAGSTSLLAAGTHQRVTASALPLFPLHAHTNGVRVESTEW
jgi:hypothetical protein